MRTFAALVLVLAGACVSPPVPPVPAPTRDATPVAASFDATWNAVIDHFAATNIPISTIERASGIIATARLSVTREDAMVFADCGGRYPAEDLETLQLSGVRLQRASMERMFVASSVVYNVLVRGDGERSSVRVTASWDTDDPAAPFRCETTGQWESDMEAAVRERAEGQ